MSFKTHFLHTLISSTISQEDKTICDFLPAGLPYSTQAAEHIMYLKAAGLSSFPTNTRYAQKNFHSYLILYSMHGNASLEYQNGSYSIQDGSLCFIDCRSEYRLYCSTPWEFQVLFFDGYPVAYYYDIFSESSEPVFSLPETSMLPQLLSRIISQNYNQPEIMNAKLLTDILSCLLDDCRTQTDNLTLPQYLSEIKTLLDTDYAAPFSLEHLSKQFHINKYQICRDFKKYLNTTPLKYSNTVRLEHAKLLLQNTTLQINEIGWRVGYENVNHFIQTFKREIGVTPAMYRKKGY